MLLLTTLRPASVDPTRIKALPADPIGPLPEPFNNDHILVLIDQIRACRHGSVTTYGQFQFLYKLFGKVPYEEATAIPRVDHKPESEGRGVNLVTPIANEGEE